MGVTTVVDSLPPLPDTPVARGSVEEVMVARGTLVEVVDATGEDEVVAMVGVVVRGGTVVGIEGIVAAVVTAISRWRGSSVRATVELVSTNANADAAPTSPRPTNMPDRPITSPQPRCAWSREAWGRFGRRFARAAIASFSLPVISKLRGPTVARPRRRAIATPTPAPDRPRQRDGRVRASCGR